MRKISILLLFVTINIFFANPILANENAKYLPLMPAGKHITITEGYNSLNPQQTESNIKLRWQEAVSKGMKISTVQFDWSQLETQPNQYNKNLLESTLKRMQSQGLKPFVVIPTVDSDRLSIPSDLVDYNTRTWFKYGMKLDDPRVINRFNKLLDWVVPMVVAHGGWALSVANEPNTYIVDRNEADRAFLKPSLVNFLSAVRSHAHSINPDLAITMTLSQNLVESGETFHINLLEECDLAIFTYYAIDPNYYFSSDPTEVNQEIDELLAAAGDKYLVLQELGAASGYGYAGNSNLTNNDSFMNASFNKQKQFFNIVFSKMEQEPRFRAATVFQIVDWDENLVETEHLAFFRNEGIVSSDYLDRFGESLATTGLIHIVDGSPKPAWHTFTNWIQRFNNPQPVNDPQPESIDAQPEPVVEVQPERTEEQPEPVVEVQPEPTEEQPEPVVEVQPEPTEEQPEPVVEVQPEPTEEQPEPVVDVQPEPVEAQPEPVDVQREHNHRRREHNHRQRESNRRRQREHNHRQRDRIGFQLLD